MNDIKRVMEPCKAFIYVLVVVDLDLGLTPIHMIEEWNMNIIRQKNCGNRFADGFNMSWIYIVNWS